MIIISSKKGRSASTFLIEALIFWLFIDIYGAADRIRTGDLRFTKAPLYQLSYSGVSAFDHYSISMRENKSPHAC